MTGPLSSAIRGATYTGTMGNDLNSLAGMAAGLAKGRASEIERQRQAALDAALQKLRESELGLRREGLDLERRGQDQAGARFAGEQVRWAEGNNLDRDKEANDLSEGAANRASAEKVARIGAQSREAVANTRGAAAGSGRDYVIREDDKGNVWRVNKVTGRADKVTVDVDGNMALLPASDSEQAAMQLTGVGARPSEGEKGAAAAYGNLQTTFDALKQNMATVGNTPPSIGEQVALDASKDPGTGLFGSLKRALGNTYVGNNAPERQRIQQSVDALGTMVVKMVTGAQMSEPEAQRIMNILRTVAGDTPENIQQKLATVQDIINNEKVKLGRAAGLVEGGSAASTAPARKWILPDGTVVE